MKYNFITFFLLSLLFIGFSACTSKETPDFSPYISGYTNGIVTSSSTLAVCLAKTPDKGFQEGSALPDRLVKINPSIKGELSWKGHNCIEFTPSEPFQNGTTYEATFDLGALCSVPEKFQKFSFQFKVIPLSILFEGGVLLNGAGQDSTLSYEGTLVSSDFIAPEILEKKLSLSYPGDSPQIKWEHESNRHRFTIQDLKKGTTSQTLTLVFDKDIQEGGKKEVPIPGIDEFTVLNVNVTEDEQPAVMIYMSEAINPDQDLNGLITIGNQSSLNSRVRGNIIYVYPRFQENDQALDITVHKGIQSMTGKLLQNNYVHSIRLKSAKPEVKLIGKGIIVPGNGEVILPFSAVALKAVDLEIIQVLEQNMNFFFQENNYDDRSELARTARPVFLKKIDLRQNHPNLNLNRWNDFTVNLSDLVQLKKGVIYRIQLKFKKSYTTLPCAEEEPDSDYSTFNWDIPGYYYTEYYYPDGYRWEEQNNPCHISYYNGDHFAAKNIINTSLGILAKKGADNQYIVVVNDLATCAPVSNCLVSLYNYQNQRIDSAYTDKNGWVNLHPKGEAFIVVATQGEDRAWLKLGSGNALSLSNFDVSGQHVQMGVKGFIYGERGVWRPGDELYLSLILEDKLQVLPEGHPILAQLIDPNGNIVETHKRNLGKNNIYCFTFQTEESAQTGYWTALFRVGGLTFKKTLRIETVKPNRLAINMHFPNEKVIGTGISTAPVKVTTKWLNGAATSHQKAMVEVRLSGGNGGFTNYSDYTFVDKSRYYEPTTETLFDGQSNAEGNFSFPLDKIKTENAPGMLNATFTTRVFENGGDFSISSQALRYSPYTKYVGIRLPQTEDNWYSTETPVQLSGITVTPAGQKSGDEEIEIEVYKLDWHWWWDSEDENIASYVNREYRQSTSSQKVKTHGGTFTASLKIDRSGRYFIRAIAPSGHSAGIIAYFGGWWENSNQETATVLRLKTNKSTYQVGEKIQVTIPATQAGIAIVSLENGKTINRVFRQDAAEGKNVIELEATSDMCPNTYVAVTLIQPYQRDNDRPIRMYGVINVNVEDPALHLHPEIKIPEELRPAKDFTLQIKERNGKSMNYTIAIVDEGLLSITTFRTPDPFSAFYAREALGVETWDFYDYLFGAYGAKLDKAFAVGGDEALKNLQDEKTNRFKPVVIFDGPFTLQAGKTAKHTYRMPEYIGEVRTMVVAATNGQYGAAAANSTVNKPLMVSVALPRLLTPGDIIDIPVTVFAMKDNIREVTVNLTTDDKITLLGNSSQPLRFQQKGEQVVYFKAKINTQTGVSTLQTEAVSGKEQATVTEDITVRIPNPPMTLIEAKEVKPGETINFNTAISGIDPLSVLELSTIPPLNLEQRLTYLLDYPHGCAEQITSQAFPQLSLPWLLALTPEQKQQAEKNIKDVISQLSKYQTSLGGFAYWQGQPYISEWVTAYIVQFLVSARQAGYTVSLPMLQNAINYMKRVSNSWTQTEPWSQLTQAYRLYVLALAQQADLAAMNRFRELKTERPVSQWLLASAYALAGQPEAAQRLVSQLSSDVAPYRETGHTFGSTTRDNALILQSMVTLDMQQDAYRMLEKISRAMGSGDWYSTQETAFALHAASLFVRKYLGTQRGVQATVNSASGTTNIDIENTIWQTSLPVRQGQSVATVKNTGTGNLFARQINTFTSLEVITARRMDGLAMEIRYYNDQGQPVNIRNLSQGEDVTAEISVKNTGLTGTYNELALSYLVPSGFEIINDRLTGNNNAWQGAEYVDVRDDRFYVYFDLQQNQTKTFKFRCNAAFKGEYLLPAITCSAMYDNSIQAVLPGGKININ